LKLVLQIYIALRKVKCTEGNICRYQWLLKGKTRASTCWVGTGM